MAAGDGQADASGKAQGRAGVSPVRLGVWLAIVVLALDQASKLWLMFGADIALTAKGAYRFTVGTRLADGKKRQFEFEYTVK